MQAATYSFWRCVMGVLVFSVCALTGCDGRRLISDQEMINHFNAHKPEFNALVQTFLHYGTNPMEWSQRTGVVELKAKTGVDRILDGPGYWFDDPYSLAAAEKLKKMDENKDFKKNHFRKDVIVKMQDVNVFEAVYFLEGGFNWKDYYYFPIDPAIESGRIKWFRDEGRDKKYDLWLRVVDSLDSLEWSKGECVLRKIEPKWYLSRCRAN